jgi:hypothetical protein
MYKNVFPPNYSRKVLCLMKYVSNFHSLWKKENEMFLASYINVCREKGLLLSFVYKFGWVASRCC